MPLPRLRRGLGLSAILVCWAALAAPAQAAPPAAKPPYAYTAAPGRGLQAADVQVVLRTWRNETHGMGMRVVEDYFLLLKDGGWHDGLPPVAFEDFDAAASRAGEPRRWGRWRKVGGAYHLSRDSRPNDTARKIDAASVREPARRDERLEGTWGASSAYATAWSVAQSHRSVSFDKAGRFVKASGGSVTGGAGADPGTAAHGSVVHDDDHRSASVGGPNFGGGSSARRASSLPERSGSYRLDGYTLELRYDSGRVERLPFCAAPDRQSIWFEGHELARAKPQGG